jgi:hypothetical protein
MELNVYEALINKELLVLCISEQQTAHSPMELVNARTLLDLPAEIQLGILDFIGAPTDLKSLCLTCKALHAEATIRLYRKISLPVELLNEDLIKSLNAQNRGLAHVRVLEINEGGHDHYRQTTHEPHLGQILRTLPRDSLTAIWISTQYGVSSWIDQIVVETQTKLLNFVGHAAGQAGITPYILPQDRLFNITSFVLHIESTDDILRYLGTLSKLRNLTYLNITILWAFDDGTRHNAVSTPEVVKALLHGNAQSTGITEKVTRLMLEGFDFEYCARELVHFLHANPIHHLALIGCQDSWRVLKRVAKQPLNLRSFVDENFESVEDQDEATGSINNFLQSFGGLSELKMTYEPNLNDEWASCKGVAWNAIQAHASSLRILQIDDALLEADCWKAHRSMDAFDKLCTSLVCLKQLKIRPPNVNRDFWNAPSGFMSFLDCLKHLRSLTALKLMVRPESMKDYVKVRDGAAEPQSPVPRLAELEMQELADIVFSLLHNSCPRLTALVLYATGNWNAEDPLDRLLGHDFGYLRGTRVDPDGSSSIAAHSIAFQEIKYHEPCSDIFEECLDPNWATGLI